MRVALALALLSIAIGCQSSPAPAPPTTAPPAPASTVTALFDTSPARPDFFALPWPSDDRLVTFSDGTRHLDLSGFHYPGAGIGSYLSLFYSEPTTGFSTAAAIFFRFDGSIDPATLPQSPAASIAPSSSVFLVDVTQGSPTWGKRIPIRTRFNFDYDAYIGPDSLTLLPEPGFALRERTTYAAVITDSLLGADDRPVKRDPHYVPPSRDLPLGVDPAHVVVSTIYTTGDVTSTMRALRDAVHAQAPTPRVANFHYIKDAGRFDWYEGTYDAPNYQEGDPPYLKSGGRIHLGPDGKPLAVRTETLRFALTVPHGAMPQSGWPIVLYAHGTGGDYRSFIDDGSAADAALVQDARGNELGRLAMISIDQVLHGPRDPTGSDPELTFYNFQNLVSARDSIKQGALDDFSLLRLVENMNIASAPGTNATIRFDSNKVYFKGHSQGGSTGPLFLAFEPDVKAAILSGAGAMLEIALLNKTQPVNIPNLITALVGEPVDEYHPLLNLMQTFLDSADPLNYAKYFFREPPAGFAPKSIYQSLGLIDHYTPIPAMKALALAMGVQPVTPQLEPIDALAITGLKWAPPPIMDNVAMGAATGVLCEYPVPQYFDGSESYDGHFVVFNDPDAIRQSNAFLATHAQGGTAILIP